MEISTRQVRDSCKAKTRDGKEITTDVDRMVCTIESALLATTIQYLQSPDGQGPLSPLRPKTFDFRFAVDVSATKGGGFELDLKPVPKLLKFGGGGSEASVTTLTLKFGPEP